MRAALAVVCAGPRGKTHMPNLTDSAVSMADRVAAARALGTSKDPLALETLLRGLGSTDEKLTEAILGSLKALGAAPVLAKRLTAAASVESLKVQACVGLRHLKDPASVPALAAALRDDSALVRREAALALTVLGPAGAEEELIAALGDTDGDVRYGAADALGRGRSPKARKAIDQQLARETNPTVRFALEGASQRLAAQQAP